MDFRSGLVQHIAGNILSPPSSWRKARFSSKNRLCEGCAPQCSSVPSERKTQKEKRIVGSLYRERERHLLACASDLGRNGQRVVPQRRAVGAFAGTAATGREEHQYSQW